MHSPAKLGKKFTLIANTKNKRYFLYWPQTLGRFFWERLKFLKIAFVGNLPCMALQYIRLQQAIFSSIQKKNYKFHQNVIRWNQINNLFWRTTKFDQK